MSSAQRLARMFGLTLAVAVGLFLLGYAPTVRLAGQGAIRAMVAGLAVSMVASLLGSLPLVTIEPGSDPQTVPTRALGSMLIRFVAILTFALALALSGWFQRTPFLIWIALSHLAFLSVDTVFALRAAQSTRPSE